LTRDKQSEAGKLLGCSVRRRRPQGCRRADLFDDLVGEFFLQVASIASEKRSEADREVLQGQTDPRKVFVKENVSPAGVRECQSL